MANNEVLSVVPQRVNDAHLADEQSLIARRLFRLALLLLATQIFCLAGMVVLLGRGVNPLVASAPLIAFLSLGRSFRIVISPSVVMRNSSSDKGVLPFNPDAEPLNEVLHGLVGLAHSGSKPASKKRVKRPKLGGCDPA